MNVAGRVVCAGYLESRELENGEKQFIHAPDSISEAV